MACDDHKHPLRRGGTNQAGRLTPGLRPDYVRVDEKEISDWLAYAEELAELIKYWDITNTEVGDWKPLFSQNISAVLAFVAVQDGEALQGFSTRFAVLRADDNQGDPALLKETFAELFGGA